VPLTRVRWSRDWRLGRSLVGAGTLQIDGGTLALTGRRTGPVRSLLVLALRLGAVGVFVAGCGAVTLTSIGMTWRTKTPEWLAWSIPGFLAVLLLSLLAAWLGRRILEPRVVLRARWAAVQALRSDGWRLELVLRQGTASWTGRMRPRPITRESRLLMAELAQGRCPPGAPAQGWPAPRSRRLDQLALACILGAGGVGLHLAWPRLAPLLGDRPEDGPVAGIPDRAPAQDIDALTRACPLGPAGAPLVQDHLEGAELRWSPEQLPPAGRCCPPAGSRAARSRPCRSRRRAAAPGPWTSPPRWRWPWWARPARPRPCGPPWTAGTWRAPCAAAASRAWTWPARGRPPDRAWPCAGTGMTWSPR